MENQIESNKNIEEKILKSIKETGFPFELRVNKILNEKSYLVASNLFYIDEDENKGREIDFRALKNFEFESEGYTYFVRNCFFIECKKSTKYSWVVFTSDFSPYDNKIDYLDRNGTRNENKFLPLGFLHKNHPFAKLKRVGRGYFEVFSNNEEKGHQQIFKALTASAKATISARNSKYAGVDRSICFYYPLIIFDGNLYEAYLDKDIVLNKSDCVYVSFHYQSPNYEDEHFLIPIITENYLPIYLREMDRVLTTKGKFFKNKLGAFKDPTPIDDEQ